MRFEQLTAVVTGGGQGIGAATCRLLAGEGARVAVLDLDLGAATGVAEEIAAQGGSALALGVDVEVEEAVEAAFARIGEQLGGADILVSNAGVTRDRTLLRMTVEEWDQVMQVHCRGAFLCARAAARQMVERRRGKMVFLSSTSALGNRGQANYSTAKAGIQGLVRTLALELGPSNVNVNAVAPGFVDTAMTRAVAGRLGLSLEEFHGQQRERIPLGRLGQPEDIARVIAFLCSEEAAYVSGQVLYVNGGRPS